MGRGWYWGMDGGGTAYIGLCVGRSVSCRRLCLETVLRLVIPIPDIGYVALCSLPNGLDKLPNLGKDGGYFFFLVEEKRRSMAPFKFL